MPTYTRPELHELVWAESRLTLAKKLGVSDVWIRKACVHANIPVPPPGYWARVAAGKAPIRPRLPTRGFGQHDRVTLGSSRDKYAPPKDPIEIPPEPVFIETLDAVRSRAQLALGKISVPRGFDRSVPAITKLLKEDEERRTAIERDRYSWKKPRFDGPAAMRRLKIINSLLVIMAKVGCVARVDKDDLSTTITVGDTMVSLRLAAKGARPTNAWQRALELADVQVETLILEVVGGGHLANQPPRWTDTDNRKLERQLPEIAVELLVHAESSYRAAQFFDRDWLIAEKQRREAEDLERRQEIERKEAARLEQLERERQDHLLDLADRLRKSDDIRLMVASMGEGREDSTALGSWRTWALDVADRLDPRRLSLEKLLFRAASAAPTPTIGER